MLLITLLETLIDIFALLPRVDVDALQITCRLFRETVDASLLQFAWRIVEAAVVCNETSVGYVEDMVPSCEPVPGVPTRKFVFRGGVRYRVRSVLQALKWARVDRLGLEVHKPKPITDDMAKMIVSISATIFLKRLSISVSRISPATLTSMIHSFRELEEVCLLQVQSDKMNDSILQTCEEKGVALLHAPQEPVDGGRYRMTAEGVLSFMLGSRVGARRRKLKIHSFELGGNFFERLVEAFYETPDIEWAELIVRDFPKTSQKLEGYRGRLITETLDNRRVEFFDVQEEGFFARVSFETQKAAWLLPQVQSLWVRFTNDPKFIEDIQQSWAHPVL